MNAAHWHLLLNHIPVLGGIASLGFVCLGLYKKDKSILNLSLQWMILIGLISLPAYFTGEPAEEVIEHLPGFSESLADSHEKWALYSLLATELLALLGIFGLFKFRTTPPLTKNSEKNFWKVTLLLAFINMVLMGLTANIGGKIRHTEIRGESDTTSPSPSSHDED
ncbi:MAG: hypothetical protein ACXWRE_03330 [Pseudobdellovibrionaceae bacterium]